MQRRHTTLQLDKEPDLSAAGVENLPINVTSTREQRVYERPLGSSSLGVYLNTFYYTQLALHTVSAGTNRRSLY
jgi:hypothetical protein